MLRSKGFFWVAAEPRMAYEWRQAGGASEVRAARLWWAALQREHWPQPAGERPDELWGWHPRLGDRVQQRVFIGRGLDEATIRARLQACLLDEPLLRAGSAAWSELPCPFPALPVQGEDAA